MSKAINTIVAAAAGFAAGILLAPKSGKETREDIRTKALETKGYVDEKATQTMGTIKEGAAKAEAEARNMAKNLQRSASSIASQSDDLEIEVKERASRAAEKNKGTTKGL